MAATDSRTGTLIGGGLCRPGTRAVAVIRVDAVWLAVTPLDMRAGTESARSRGVNVFGTARPHTKSMQLGAAKSLTRSGTCLPHGERSMQGSQSDR
jgi:hypothetical protein